VVVAVARRRHRADQVRAGRRFTDLVEDVAAWVLTSAGALLLVAAILAGFAAYGSAAERSRVERATRTPSEAVLLEDARSVSGEQGMVRGTVAVPARWVGADGTTRTGPVTAGAAARAGATVTVWLDRDGRSVERPVDEVGAVVVGGVSAVTLLLGGGGVLAACWAGVRRLVWHANSARWEREWARVGPEWSRRVP
jgi:hypothetical protein